MSSGPIRAGTITGTSESGSAGTITVKDMGDIDPGQKVTLLVSMYLTRCANLSRMTMSGDLWKPDSTGTVQATVPLQDVSFNWGCRLAWDPSKEVSESSLKSAQAFLESKLLPPNMPMNSETGKENADSHDDITAFKSGVKIPTALSHFTNYKVLQVKGAEENLMSVYEAYPSKDDFHFRLSSRTDLINALPPMLPDAIEALPAEADQEHHERYLASLWKDWTVGDMSTVVQPSDGTLLISIVRKTA